MSSIEAYDIVKDIINCIFYGITEAQRRLHLKDFIVDVVQLIHCKYLIPFLLFNRCNILYHTPLIWKI